jgi:hypothetical protein
LKFRFCAHGRMCSTTHFVTNTFNRMMIHVALKSQAFGCHRGRPGPNSRFVGNSEVVGPPTYNLVAIPAVYRIVHPLGSRSIDERRRDCHELVHDCCGRQCSIQFRQMRSMHSPRTRRSPIVVLPCSLQLCVSHYNVSVTIEIRAAHPKWCTIQEETIHAPRKNYREAVARGRER